MVPVRSLLLGLALLACSAGGQAAPEQIEKMDDRPVLTPDRQVVSEDEATSAILQAVAKAPGWTASRTGPSTLRATGKIGEGSATIEITVFGSVYSIQHIESTGLGYDAKGPSIDAAYNAAVRGLAQAIDSGLVIAPVAAAAAPAAAAPAGPDPMKDVHIGIAMTALPEISSQVPGANCLLCIAAAKATVSSLTGHLQSLPTDDLVKVKEEIAARLRKRGAQAVVIDEPLDVKALSDFPTKGKDLALKDFTALAEKYRVDKLLVIEIGLLGVTRTFSAYIPRGDPKAVLNSSLYILNLKTNAYELRRPVNVLKAADGAWDEPPKFPGMTNAYYQTLELARDRYLDEFER